MWKQGFPHSKPVKTFFVIYMNRGSKTKHSFGHVWKPVFKNQVFQLKNLVFQLRNPVFWSKYLFFCLEHFFFQSENWVLQIEKPSL